MSRAFCEALASAGFTPPEKIIADGKLHRFRLDGDQQAFSWYVLTPDSPAVGAAGCWKRGSRVDWSEKGAAEMTAAELAEYQERKSKIDAEISQGLDDFIEERARRAQELWGTARPADDSHPYLTAAGVRAHGLRVHDRDGEQLLLVPVNNAQGRIRGMQYIYKDGFQGVLIGTQISGNLFLIGDPGGAVVVFEDYVGAARHFETTGEAAAVAFTAENVSLVGEALTQRFPDARVVASGERQASHETASTAETASQATAPLRMDDEPGNDGRTLPAEDVGKVDLWMPLFPADYLADTQHLTTEQHGAYLLLIMAAWMAGGVLPSNEVQLRSITRLDVRTWARHRKVLLAFFQRDGDALIQKRVLREYARAVEVNAKRTAIGRLGGRARETLNKSS